MLEPSKVKVCVRAPHNAASGRDCFKSLRLYLPGTCPQSVRPPGKSHTQSCPCEISLQDTVRRLGFTILGIQPRVGRPESRDTTPKRMAEVTLHGVVSPEPWTIQNRLSTYSLSPVGCSRYLSAVERCVSFSVSLSRARALSLSLSPSPSPSPFLSLFSLSLPLSLSTSLCRDPHGS